MFTNQLTNGIQWLISWLIVDAAGDNKQQEQGIYQLYSNEGLGSRDAGDDSA